MNTLQNSKSGKHAENITSDYVFLETLPRKMLQTHKY